MESYNQIVIVYMNWTEVKNFASVEMAEDYWNKKTNRVNAMANRMIVATWQKLHEGVEAYYIYKPEE